MRALVLEADQQLVLKEVPTPEPGEGEVLVKIRAAALNHREIWISRGLYPGMKLPSILGADGAGVVAAVGHGVDGAWIGESVVAYPATGWYPEAEWPTRDFKVLGMPQDGTIAEYVLLPEENLCRKPEYLSFEEAASLPVAALTAWRGLTQRGRVYGGQKVLINGIGGGVAQFGLAFALALGAEVFVTSSRQEKIDRAIDMGATGGVRYTDGDWPEQLRSLTGGIDVVLDGAPLPELDRYLKFLNVGGKVVYYGSTGGRNATINLSKFFLRQISLLGTTMGSPQDFVDMLAFMELHELRPLIDSVFPFEEAIAAFDALRNGGQFGKIVISDFPA
ncbi:NAD(P)-dependent alcohol dehydrogenase [Lewinella sp. W8]|uniref:quinone oxidoreductase family protein n=1 Tax=Lewinella sp. W8 TaxID=2528208 RepID=UPI0010679531|nr:NAD(P)-dependent alcohol dehydrogenase [Lewinella sp. W8]MTB50444.1 zinc-binding dehydrogenase [Lewinella sp. W8]